MKPRASFRLFRSGLIGSLVLVLAAGGHLAGGGQLPALPILAALCVITMLPVAALTRFRLSFPVLAGLIGGGQLWLHWGFDALSMGTPATVAPALLPTHAGHNAATVHHETLLMAVSAHGTARDELMIAAHAVVTLCAALLLARGEQALAGLAGWLRPLLHSAEPLIVVPARVASPCVTTAVLPPAHHALRLPPRRGPPMLTPAA